VRWNTSARLEAKGEYMLSTSKVTPNRPHLPIWSRWNTNATCASISRQLGYLEDT